MADDLLIVTQTDTIALVSEGATITFVSTGAQGPQGPPGEGTSFPQFTKTSDFIADINTLYIIDSSGNDVLAAIPAGESPGDIIKIKHWISGNQLILDGTDAGVTMDGSVSLISTDRYDYYELTWNGSGWMVT